MAKRGCAACAAARAKLLREAKSGQLAQAAGTAVKGVGMMLGAVKKEDENDDESTPRT